MDREHGGRDRGKQEDIFGTSLHCWLAFQKLRKVILEDQLGICNELDAFMDNLIDTYEDEWAKVVQG